MPPNYNDHIYNSLKRINIANSNNNKFDDNKILPFIYHTENDYNSVSRQNNNQNIRNINNNIHNNINLINSNSTINIKPFKNVFNKYPNYNNNIQFENELNKNEPIFIEIEPKIITNGNNSKNNSETVMARNNKELLNNKFKTQVNNYNLEDTDIRTNRIDRYIMPRIKTIKKQ